MVIITCLYLAFVYLLFFKFKLLPWNRISQVVCMVIGVVILTGFLVGLQGLTPSSTQAFITGRVVESVPSEGLARAGNTCAGMMSKLK